MSSEYFALTRRRPSLPRQPAAHTRAAPAAPAAAVAPRPHIAVAKKLLPRAVDRNLVKRLVREAWRMAPAQEAAVLIRLKQRPAGWLASSRRARKRLLREQLSALLAATRPSPAARNRP